jgi:hypothetical protein
MAKQQSPNSKTKAKAAALKPSPSNVTSWGDPQ